MRFPPLVARQRLGIEIAAILLAKAAMLGALYALFFSSAVAPSSSAVGRHLVGSSQGDGR